MIIQILLTAGLAVLFVYALIARKGARLLSRSMLAVTLIGLVFVWMPDLSTALAHQLGVGRGTDLLFYVWILASMLIAFNLHLTCRRLSRDLGQLARGMAIEAAVEEYHGQSAENPRNA